ncbi:sensor histidine kinase [Phytomonospora endophytica]|uniref:histidine kinase n=1 Tax=Phytomonospora endophytica TaxID=714109 RepID=A0A841FP27_9ACTN|nr:histidine kinase [Phytomonospora endophytica]MBB6037584.1 signal transduction histidine kinase [Phytomonospora endophytica]
MAIAALFIAAEGYLEFNAPLWSLVYGAIVAIPILLVSRHSLLAWLLAVGASFWFGVLVDIPGTSTGTWPWNPVQALVLLWVLFVVGLRRSLWTLATVWGVTIFMLNGTITARQNLLAMCLLFTVPLIVGAVVGRNFKLGQRLAAEQERGGVLTERARIARELHDVVAHHMSMIAVRAETAPYRLSDVGEDSRTEFAEISSAAREALTEMRLLLGVLRSDETTAPPTAPQPQISDLPDLAASARHAGAEVDLSISPEVGEVPQIVGVSAYRIIQEALSNVARHAPGAAASVSVSMDGDVLLVLVENGPGTRPSAGGGSGYGLRGAGERATILGGRLVSGPTPSGGYRVEARLPVREA